MSPFNKAKFCMPITTSQIFFLQLIEHSSTTQQNMSIIPFESQEDEDLYGFETLSTFSRSSNGGDSIAASSFMAPSSSNTLRASMSTITCPIRISADNEEGHEKLKQYKVLPRYNWTNVSCLITLPGVTTEVSAPQCGQSSMRPSIFGTKCQYSNATTAASLSSILYWLVNSSLKGEQIEENLVWPLAWYVIWGVASHFLRSRARIPASWISSSRTVMERGRQSLKTK